MKPYIDEFDVSVLTPALRKKCFNNIVTPALAHLDKAGYRVRVSRDLRDLKPFWAQYVNQKDLYQSAAFDADFHHPSEPAQGLFLETPEGIQVGTVWTRTIDLRDPRTLESLTLKQALERLNVFYHDPLDAPRRETCIVECEIAEDIKRGTISYGGALWIHPAYQGKGLFPAFSALSRILAITTREIWHWFVILTEEKNRMLALDHFPCRNFTIGVTHHGIPNVLCTATYQEAMQIALKDI